MEEKSIFRSMLRLALVTAFLLLIPFVFKWPWSLADFIIMGVLIFGTSLAYTLLSRKSGNIVYRLAVLSLAAVALLLIWVNLAVGLIGSEDQLINLIYFGVLAIAIIGAVIARLEPHGMARALLVAALVQVLIGVVAVIAGMHQHLGSSSAEILGVNSFFVALWATTALLFQYAARFPELPKEENIKQGKILISNIFSWSFVAAFFSIGILNIFLVHPVPGIFYIFISLIYVPETNIFLKRKFGFKIPRTVKIIFGFVILWGTLAVGDLAEILGL